MDAARPPAAGRETFEQLILEHHRPLLAYARALAGTAAAADDLLQEALLAAFRRFDDFDPARGFAAWVRGFVRLKHLEAARARDFQALDPAWLDAVDAIHTAWDGAGRDGRPALVEALRDCIAGLDAEHRDAVLRHYEKNHSCGAIAEQLGLAEAAVRKRLQRARDRLAACVRGKLA